MWLTMNSEWDPETAKKKALSLDVFFKAGSDCAVQEFPESKEAAKRSMRLCFAHYNPEKLTEGGKRLSHVFMQ